MSDVLLDVQGTPTTPAPGQGVLYFDTLTRVLSMRDEGGKVRGLDGVNNFSTVAQTPAAATRTYIVGSALAVPVGKLRIGTILRWRFNLTKTAAGAAASTFDVSVGVNGTTADVARVSFTKPAGTGAVDEGWVDIEVICRGPLSAVGVFVGTFRLIHNLAATGHAVIPCVVVTTISGGFDVTVANLIVGVNITSGAADAITIQNVTAEAVNL